MSKQIHFKGLWLQWWQLRMMKQIILSRCTKKEKYNGEHGPTPFHWRDQQEIISQIILYSNDRIIWLKMDPHEHLDSFSFKMTIERTLGSLMCEVFPCIFKMVALLWFLSPSKEVWQVTEIVLSKTMWFHLYLMFCHILEFFFTYNYILIFIWSFCHNFNFTIFHSWCALHLSLIFT